MTIRMDEFFDRPADEEPKTGQRASDPVLNIAVTQLQAQVEELSLFLEEERLNHRETHKKTSDDLERRSNLLAEEKEFRLKRLTDDYEEQLRAMKDDYESKISRLKTETSQTMGKMKGEIEFLHGSFESFKTALTGETNDKWKRKETELQASHQEELKKQIHELKVKVVHEQSSEKASIVRDHNREIQVLQRDHGKEIEALMRRYAGAAATEEQLKQTELQLQKTTKTLEDLRKKYKSTHSKLESTIQDFTDTRFRLAQFESRFDDKVQEVDAKYRDEIHELMRQNTEVRRMYMKKCGQLMDEKTITDSQMMTRVKSAKDTMRVIINTRHKANVSLAAVDPRLENRPREVKSRPVSAPATRHETTTAALSAGETDHLTLRVSEPPIMPDSLQLLLEQAGDNEHLTHGHSDTEIVGP